MIFGPRSFDVNNTGRIICSDVSINNVDSYKYLGVDKACVTPNDTPPTSKTNKYKNR